jgi:riboflavin kinase/FMN adenylyltransferase
LRVVRGSAALGRSPLRAVLTIGNFDGLHIGHRQILRTVIDRARAHDGEAVVYTFDPHPRKVLQSSRAPSLLTTTEQKLELLAAAQIDLVVIEPFTAEFAKTSAEVFVREHVHERVAPLEVYVGYDFHYGRDRAGSMRLLTELGPRLGFAVTIIPEVTIGGRDVSSSRIRELLAAGDVEEAKRMLGRSFAVRGTVTRGDHRGHKLGFPTANLAPENEVMPARGVYAGHVLLLEDGTPPPARAAAVTNVGAAHLQGGRRPVLAEAHLLDFAGISTAGASRCLRARLRGEALPDGDALRAQIARDVEVARRAQSP